MQNAADKMPPPIPIEKCLLNSYPTEHNSARQGYAILEITIPTKNRRFFHLHVVWREFLR